MKAGFLLAHRTDRDRKERFSMRNSRCAWALIIVTGGLSGLVRAQNPATAAAPPAQAGRGGGRGGRGGRAGGFTGPSISVRPPDQGLPRTVAATILGWHLGVRADAFGPITFSEAAAKADSAGMAFVEGVSSQKVSPEIPRNLDYNLAAADLEKVKARLNELRLRMPAYFADTIPSDSPSRRKLFEFAKSLGAEVIICSPDSSSLAALDQLATEMEINVAVESRNPKDALSRLEGRSSRIGLNADLGAWKDSGIKPQAGLAQLKDKVLAATLRVSSTSGGADLTAFFLELSRFQAPGPPVDYPPPPGHDGGGESRDEAAILCPGPHRFGKSSRRPVTCRRLLRCCGHTRDSILGR